MILSSPSITFWLGSLLLFSGKFWPHSTLTETSRKGHFLQFDFKQSCFDHGPWTLLLLENSVLIPYHKRNSQECDVNFSFHNHIVTLFLELYHFQKVLTASSRSLRNTNGRGFQFFKKPYSEPKYWPLLLPESLSSSPTIPKNPGEDALLSFDQSSSNLIPIFFKKWGCFGKSRIGVEGTVLIFWGTKKPFTNISPSASLYEVPWVHPCIFFYQTLPSSRQKMKDHSSPKILTVRVLLKYVSQLNMQGLWWLKCEHQ